MPPAPAQPHGPAGPHNPPHSRAGRRGSLIPLKPDLLLTPAQPTAPKAHKFNCELLWGVAPMPPAALPVPQFPSFARELPWVGCPQSSGTKGPHCPQDGHGVETWVSASPCCARVQGWCLQILPPNTAKGEQFISSPCRQPLERRRAGGWKTGSCGPCPPTQHGKSGDKLLFQETAASAAKKHEPEQSPAIFGLETTLLQA